MACDCPYGHSALRSDTFVKIFRMSRVREHELYSKFRPVYPVTYWKSWGLVHNWTVWRKVTLRCIVTTPSVYTCQHREHSKEKERVLVIRHLFVTLRNMAPLHVTSAWMKGRKPSTQAHVMWFDISSLSSGEARIFQKCLSNIETEGSRRNFGNRP
jgi:hypothetical protein